MKIEILDSARQDLVLMRAFPESPSLEILVCEIDP
jgi:hypothetical protein